MSVSFDARDPTRSATRATVRQAGEIEPSAGVARCVARRDPVPIRPRPFDLRESRANVGPRSVLPLVADSRPPEPLTN